jgi:hypothetical protein
MGQERVTTYQLGDFIDIYCRFCKLNLTGVVSAIVNGEVVKVQCRTCKNFQDYKPTVDEEEKKRKALRRVLKRRDSKSEVERAAPLLQAENLSQEAVVRRLWEEAIKDTNPLKTPIYSPNHIYSKDDIITHPDYGLGVVGEVGTDFVFALFRDGYKRLEHNRQKEETE